MTKLKLWSAAIFFVLALASLSSCKKDKIEEILPGHGEVSPMTTRVIAAAANAKNTDSDEDCGCYSAFDNIDFEGTDEQIEAAIDAVLASMTEAEIEALFTPVCVDGEIYESACMADCEGITNYAVCTDEELGDYFWDDVECPEDVEFPIDIELPDGTTVTVNSYDELFDLLDEWYGEEWEGEEYEDSTCFELVFPLNVVYPDGTVVAVNDEDELEQIYVDYFENNGETEECPLLQYPYNVVDEDGNTITITNEEEEWDVFAACEDWDDEEWEEDFCFDLVYPIQLQSLDGTLTTINSEEELDAFFGDIDNVEDCPEIVFPFDIVYEDGTTATVTNEEDIDEAYYACYDDEDDGQTGGRLAQQKMEFSKRIFLQTEQNRVKRNLFLAKHN